jgi:hypothetical protein
MRPGRTRAWLAVGGVAAATVLAGCGGSTGIGSGGSTASFVVSGNAVTVTVGKGTVKESFGGNPALNYSGPEGCQGRYFTADIGSIPLTFHYSSQDAYMIFNRTVYHFVTGPQLEAGKLVWDHTFDRDHIVARVSCPVPPPSGPLLPPSS